MVVAAAGVGEGQAIHGILYNEDDSHRFLLDPPGKMQPSRLDRLVDELADSQVTVMLICCNAKKTNFPSTSWEPHCAGFDPTREEDQWAHNMLRMFELGVDPTGRMIRRCRQKGISPWVSMRMNDVHDAGHLDSRLHSRFWKEHPEYWRYPHRFNSWLDRCLNYALPPVREHALALLEEVFQRYDLDGFELDWNRFPAHFREGEEATGAVLLTTWMERVRQVQRAAEERWGHPIVLAARVPALPEVAVGLGLDAPAWAKRGLIDHLIVAPFWTTTDYDIPVEEWTALLQGTGVGVTAGVEIRIQPYPGGPTLPNTSERRRGNAMAVLARGSQGIYLFNYFDVARKYPDLLHELGAVETLRGKNRSYVVTFHDIHVPGKPRSAPLPKVVGAGHTAAFRLFVGPRPLPGAQGQVRLGLKETEGESPRLAVSVNGHSATPGPTPGSFDFPRTAFTKGDNTIHVTNLGTAKVVLEQVELRVRRTSNP